MKVHMLGTGSADGWPNPFCTCPSCASERARGSSRTSTAALVDDAILIDCGPTVAFAASHAGIDLRGVQHILVTHGHPDHLAPAFLLWRHWVADAQDLHELHIWGPVQALALCGDWLAPGAPVHLHPISPADHFDIEIIKPSSPSQPTRRYRVSVHAAQHGHGNGDVLAEEAVLYGLQAPDGTSLLYATDTGPLTEKSLEGLRDRAFNLALVDATFGEREDHGTGHLDLATLPIFLDRLRAVGALNMTSDVVAVHLSHHNPPAEQLSAILAPMGARIVDDLELIAVPRESPRLRQLILGGARSGKSRYAEGLAACHDIVTYIATAAPQPNDDEWATRVRQHRERRPAHWRTLETSDLVGALGELGPGEVALIDCIGMWLTARLDEADAWTEDRDAANAARERVMAEVSAMEVALGSCHGSVILVSNEVGMDVVPATASGRLFRDLLGTVNARLASMCDEVTLMVAGRPLPLPAVPGNSTPSTR